MAKIATVEFIGANGVATRSPDETTTAVVWKWADGVRSRVNIADLPDNIRACAAAHGLKQKGSDEYSGAESVEIARGLHEALMARLTGEGATWNGRSTGGTDSWLLAQALAEATGTELATVIAKMSDWDKAKRDDTRKHPQVAAIVARLELERQQAKLDAAQAAAADADPLPEL